MSTIWTTPTEADNARSRPDDEGTILVMVLVMMVIGSLIILPLLVYTLSVFRSGSVETAKAEAVELARGGTWVALANQEDLYDLCIPGDNLSGSLDDVTTTCEIVEVNALRPAAEIPYHVTTVRSDVPIPAPIATADTININTTAVSPDDWDRWMDTPDWSTSSAANKVWLPELPVQATSTGVRTSFMPAGTFDNPPFASCDVYFPGTFNSAIDISAPTYFTSGVYYFTEPITIHSGAHVVVGNGGAGGCTTDFEAVASADSVPTPLNMSGYGGTFVLGDNARIVIDDSGAGDIFFAMNQRYVAPDDTSVLASVNVSIISVNGTHAPLYGAETLGDDLVVNGVIHVPASTVGNGDPVSPLAVDSGYTPSNLTNKPEPPDPPTGIMASDWTIDIGPGLDPGRLHVTWDAPNENGSPITGYTARDTVTGQECSTFPPTLPDTSIQTACTIVDINHPDGVNSNIVVTATTAYGSTDSAPFVGPEVDGEGTGQSPVAVVASAPQNLTVTEYSDGNAINWDPPVTVGSWPISGYRVTATPSVAGPPVVTCEAWWDETSCILKASDGFIGNGSTQYIIEVVAIQRESAPYQEYAAPAATLLPSPTPIWFTGATAAPIQTPAVWAGVRIPEPIVDLTTTSAAEIDVIIEGYVSVPQGRIEIGALDPTDKKVHITGGVVAGDIWLDPSEPADLLVYLDNPISQKRMKIHSVTSGDYIAVSEAIVQVNRSGSIAINSWYVQ